jgi:hypothetical protein
VKRAITVCVVHVWPEGGDCRHEVWRGRNLGAIQAKVVRAYSDAVRLIFGESVEVFVETN